MLQLGFGNEMATIGQCVQISESEAGIVLEAATLLDGKPVYKVLRAFDDQGDGGTTHVLSALPIEIGGHLCKECPLFYDGRCGLNQLDLAA